MPDEFLTTHQISKFCNVYPTTVINWIKEGILPAFTTPGGHRRVKKSDLIDIMLKNNMPIPDGLKQSAKRRVLVVDDDPRILKMVKTILEAEEGLEVTCAANGFEAGAMVYKFMPDLILLDFLMPDIDGFEVCRRLRKDKRLKGIPIIGVTVLKDEKDLRRMYACGVTDRITKPFKSDELVEKVREHVQVLPRQRA